MRDVRDGAVSALAVLACLLLIASGFAAAYGEGFWSDDFSDSSHVAGLSNVVLSPRSVTLAPQAAVRDGVVLSPSTSDPLESLAVQSPAVLSDGAGYRMYYAGIDGGGSSRIFMASSGDGTTWTRQGLALDLGTPGSGEEAAVGYPGVLRVGSVYYMWYAAGSGSGYRLFLATSANGSAWTRQGMVLAPTPGSWDSYQVYQASVIYENNLFRMWYTGSNITSARILYATSPDGRNWTKRGVAVAPGAPGAIDYLADQYPSVVRTASGYEMWHSCTSRSATDVLCLATSLDGTNWTKEGEVLPLQAATSEDRNLILGTVLSRPAGGFDLWYAGRGSTFQIYRASLSQVFSSSGWILSVPISIPMNVTWKWLDTEVVLAAGTAVRVTLQNPQSHAAIPGFTDLASGNVSLTGLGSTSYPRVQINATLTSSDVNSPILVSWAVGWGPGASTSTFDSMFLVLALLLILVVAAPIAAFVLLWRRGKGSRP